MRSPWVLCAFLISTLVLEPQGSVSSSGVRTVANLFIIEDDGTVLLDDNVFDLNERSVSFTPNAKGGYDVAAASSSFDSDLCDCATERCRRIQLL